MFVTIKKRSKDTSTDLCLIPADTFKMLNLSEHSLYNINVGQLEESIYIKPHDESNKNLYFFKSTFDKLALFSDANLNIWKEGFDIFLGPVVGVFVNARYLSAIKSGSPPLSAIKHIEANTEGKCITYFFSIDKINWFDNKIKGIVFAPRQNEWKEYWLPMPNVIYDRGVGFSSSLKELVKHIREQFQYHSSIHFINNQDYLGKWQLYKKLSRYPEIQPYLPDTRRYTNFRDLEDMLEKYSFIFIKSFYGSRGKEVLSIENIDSKFKLIFSKKELKTIIVGDIQSLKEHVENFMLNKPFIIQQGIRLLKFKDRNMDMRILIEKDHEGQWQSIYNQVRIAQENYTITNCSAGGSVENYDTIYLYLSLIEDREYLPVDEEIRDITINIARYIEKAFGSFGEIGMDMAIDESGKVWFIEANSKPDKNPEPHLEDTDGICPQFLSILEYSKFLVKGELDHE